MSSIGNIILIAGLSLCWLCNSARSDDLYIATAANFKPVMQELIHAYPKCQQKGCKLISGSSGKLYHQIRHGAPFDLFFSADMSKPQQLEQQGLTVADSRFDYAIGRLALWSRSAGSAQQQLLEGDWQRLAIANPKLAPYGLAALQTLKSLAIYEQSKPAMVFGENIAQSYQFIATGNADLGFVAASQLTTAAQAPEGNVWLIPATLHDPIRQQAVILSKGNTRAAAEFARFVQSEQGRQIIQRAGYDLPALIP